MKQRIFAQRIEYIPLRDLSTESSTEQINVNKPLPRPRSWNLLKFEASRLKAQIRRKLPKLPKWMNFTGWRMMASAGAILSIFVLVANTVLLIWASKQPQDPQTGAAIIYSGSRDSAQSVFTWSHLAINILSTLLLGSSNATMQCLTAPTRKEVCEVGMSSDWIPGFEYPEWAMKLRIISEPSYSC